MRPLALLALLAGCSSPVITSDGGTGGGSAGGGSAAGGSGGAGGGTTTIADAGLPAWRTAAARWQWVEIPNTALSTQPVTDPINGGMVSPTQRINAWNGLAANRSTGKIYLACAGGHADWAGNEAYEIDLDTEQPHWRLLRGPSAGNTISLNVPYYSDGRPSSTHLYYALHFVRARNRIFKMSAGSVWGDGNSNNNNVDAFSLDAGDWDSMGTFAAANAGGGAIDRPFAPDPVTDDEYTFIVGQFRKWTAATATWSNLAARPSYANDDIVQGSASAVDPTRQRVIYTRNAYHVAQSQGLQLTFGGALTDITFTGAKAADVIGSQNGMEYLPGEDVFLLVTGAGGEVLRIDPTTFAVTVQATTGTAPPDAVNGVYTRWLYLPRLKGFAYLPHGSANFWFLATE